MAQREWNPKSFFRHLTPDVLEALLEWSGLELGLDREGSLWREVYHAWTTLPEANRTEKETALLPVNDLCSTHARSYLEELAERTWTNGDGHLVEESRGWTSHDLAVRLFLANPEGFETTHQTYAVDTMQHFTEFRGRYPAAPELAADTKKKVKAAVVAYLRKTSFGTRCKVEDFSNDEKLALFVYHEDEAAPFDRFRGDDEIEPDWQRPVIRLAAIFHRETHTLLVKAGRKEQRERLRDLFAEHVVGDRAYFEDTDTSPRFCFDPLRDIDFEFTTAPEDRIEEVSVVRVIARPTHPDANRATLDLKPGLSMVGVHEVLGEYGIALDSDEITGVRLQFRFQGKGRQRLRTVSLINPNRTNLCDTKRDRIIRRNLKEWGIDATVEKEISGGYGYVGAPDLESATV